VIDLPSAKSQLSGLEPDLIEAHLAAAGRWRSLLKDRPDLSLPLDATTRANFINDHIGAEIAQRFDDRTGASLNDALGFQVLVVGDWIILRFKFVGNGAPSNYPTEQQEALARQSYTHEMMEALGIESTLFAPPTMLTCGYSLDGDQLSRVEIRRDCKGHLPWSYDIFGGEAVAEPLPLDGMKDNAKPARISSRRKQKSGQAEAEQA
jgi:hypothetical protein